MSVAGLGRILKRAAMPMALLCGATVLADGNRFELDWPDAYVAPEARLSNVGDHININGMPTRIYRFTTTRDLTSVVEYFRTHIERDYRRAPASPALQQQTVVGGRSGDFWLSLQLKTEHGMTVGTWSAMPLFKRGARQSVQRPPGFPESAQLIQQIDSFDDDKRSQIGLGIDVAPVDGVAERLESQLREAGYTHQNTPAASWPSPSEYVGLFRKEREEILVTLKQEQAGTSIMINRISALEALQ